MHVWTDQEIAALRRLEDRKAKLERLVDLGERKLHDVLAKLDERAEVQDVYDTLEALWMQFLAVYVDAPEF